MFSPNIIPRIINDENAIYVTRYIARKYKHSFCSCNKYLKVVINNNEIRINTSYIDQFNKGELYNMLKDIVILTSLTVNIMNTIIKDRQKLELFKETFTHETITISVSKITMIQKSWIFFEIKKLLTKCSKY